MYNKRGVIGIALALVAIVALYMLQFTTEAREIVTVMNPHDAVFRDSEAIYRGLDPSSVVYFFVTITDTSDTTFFEVNAARSYDPVVRADVIIQEGDRYGPLRGMLGFNEMVPNARITQRAFGSNNRPQKSYTISLHDRAGTWRGMTTIALNKHISDITRLRNQLAFDLLINIPHITSTRTQFVRLFVRDETKEFPDTMFVDFGLFTQVETINRTWLRNRGLDHTGSLYRARNFNFELAPEIRLASDPLFDEDAFNEILEIRGNNDHRKLLAMLESINNDEIHINDTIDMFFDIDNYLTWLAINILFGHTTSSHEDFFLYSPSNTTRFLFLPWDFSSSLSTLERELRGRHIHHFDLGLANFWESPLHRRFLMEEENRNLLTQRVEELLLELTPERISDQLSNYMDIVRTHSFAMPDLLFLGATPELVEEVFALLPFELNRNYVHYKNSLVTPTPFRIDIPFYRNGSLHVNWNESMSFFRDKVEYSIWINNDWSFDNSIFESHNLTSTEVNLEMLPDGIYYVRIIAHDDLENTRYASNFMRNADGYFIEGIMMFMVRNGVVIT